MALDDRKTRKIATGGSEQSPAKSSTQGATKASIAAAERRARAADRRAVERRTSRLDRRISNPDDDDNLRDSVIMFVDIVGASEVSNYLSPAAYKEFVLQFQHLFRSVCRDHFATTLSHIAPEDRLFSARGDEGILMIYPKTTVERAAGYIDDYVLIALELKRRWVLSDINRQSILSGIVPIDLAIGIHVGQIYLSDVEEEDGRVLRRPEGYAINLAKRVEAFSRSGHYTHIFLSETAHGLINRLADEKAYIFAEPHSMAAKGFSRDIRAFEVMHHFLPVNWTHELSAGRGTIELRVPKRDELNLMLYAHRLNPTNVWLAEECIRASMLCEFAALTPKARRDPLRLREAYKTALEIITYLEQGDQRDPGILVIKAHVHGDSFDCGEEQRCYIEAKDFDRFVPVLDWYHARSLVREVWHEIGGEDLSDAAICALDAAKLTPRKGSRISAHSLRDKLREAGALLERCSLTARWAAWMKLAYGRELVMWGDAEQCEMGIAEIVIAAEALEEIRNTVIEDRRFAKIRGDKRIKALAKK